MRLQWSHDDIVCGLLRVVIEDFDDNNELEIVDGNVTILKTKLSNNILNFNTHLLNNGEHDFTFIEYRDNEEITMHKKSIVINNVGPLSETVKKYLIENNKKIIYSGLCDSSHYENFDDEALPWFDRPDAEETIVEFYLSNKINKSEMQSLKDFVKNGFVILPERVSNDIVDKACADIEESINNGYQNYQWGSSNRLTHLHKELDSVNAIWKYAYVHAFLEKIFLQPSMPCQSLVYMFGSQQSAHQDTVHLTPFPAGYMCGVWVALEDIQDSSGELLVYPGSHRFKRVLLKDVDCDKVTDNWLPFADTVGAAWAKLIQESEIEPIVYRPKKGEILVWHENLMHGGSLRENKELSRKSIVTHNFAQGSIAYYDSSGGIGFMDAI